MNKEQKKKVVEEAFRKRIVKKVVEEAGGKSILAIDPATKCGWCLSLSHFGVWNLAIKKGESDGIKWLRFESILKKVIIENGVEVVAFELPVKTGHTGATIHHSKLNAIIERTCAELEVEYKTFSPSEIKKFATGKGNAPKDMVIKEAREILGYGGEDDNEADALWIFILTKKYILGY